VYMDTLEGRTRLTKQPVDAAVWYLLEHFDTQISSVYCSAATSVTILNAMARMHDIELPSCLLPFGYLTQQNVFTCGHPSQLGVTLKEWHDYISCLADVTYVHAEESTVESFRDAVRKAYSPPASKSPMMIGINFDRSGIGQPQVAPGIGHITPLGAYDEQTDTVLILDVARYKYAPYWVPVETVFHAMNSLDRASMKTRGWVTFKTGKWMDFDCAAPQRVAHPLWRWDENVDEWFVVQPEDAAAANDGPSAHTRTASVAAQATLSPSVLIALWVAILVAMINFWARRARRGAVNVTQPGQLI